MRPPPLPPVAVVAFVVFAAWAALATPEASAAREESILEAAVDLVGPGEREGHRTRLEEGQDELDVAGAPRRVTKRHGESQVSMCAPHNANYSVSHLITLKHSLVVKNSDLMMSIDVLMFDGLCLCAVCFV